MRIGFDIDGVLYPWHKYALNHLKRFNGEKISYDEFWSNPLEYYPDDVYGEIARIIEYYNQERLTYSIYERLYKLSRNHEIFYVTSRPENCKEITKKWALESELPCLDNLYIAKDKDPIIKDLHLDYYIEDLPKVVDKIKEHTKVLLINQPWNRDYIYEPRFFNTLDCLTWLEHNGTA